MKICHLADAHIGPYPGPSLLARYQDIERILDWTADRIIAEQCDLCLIAGDMFKDAKVMFDRGTEETICIGNWLRKISGAGIETIVISGTPSHDAVSGYKILREMDIPKTHIYTQPGTIMWGGSRISEIGIACLPGLNRSALMTQDEYKGLPPEQVHRIMTDKITQLCQGMSAQMPDDQPKILMAHMTYQSADKGFDDLLMQQEPILTREAVSGFDLVCLGHIHRPQQIDGKVFYSGPVERLSFNEEDIEPGFWIHETTPSSYNQFTSRFIETPARRYVTLNLDEQWIKTAVEHPDKLSEFIGTQNGSIVRLRYSCTEEIAKQVNRKALEKALYDAGAFFVSEIKANVERSDRARDVTVNESLSVTEALSKWCANQDIDEQETVALIAMTAELLESGVSE